LIAKTQLSFKHSLIINTNSTFTPPSAIATPNPILSEEAFKGLDGFSDFEADADTDDAVDYDSSETEPNSNTSEDELDISKLGLPQRLVQTLQNRGITHLFPIQVCTSLFSFPFFFFWFITIFLSGNYCWSCSFPFHSSTYFLSYSFLCFAALIHGFFFSFNFFFDKNELIHVI
jgi:hypothetical protein